MRVIVYLLAVLGVLLIPAAVQAHEVRPAYLELREIETDVYEGLWKVPARGDQRLGIYVALPEAAELIGEPIAMMSEGAFIERWRFEIAGGLGGHTVNIDGLESTKIEALVRIEHLNGAVQTTRLMPSNPAIMVAESPTSLQVGATYFVLGVEHILLGFDHLLFVLGLLLLVNRRSMLIKTITTFTIAHSITLALSVFAIITVPEGPLNACIALSILFLGIEVVRKWKGASSLTIRHPWVVAFAFGLLHGVGFASGLSLLGLPAGEVPAALLFFNIGVEAGQLAFVLIALLAVRALRTLEMDRPQWLSRVPGYCVGSLGVCWTIQRVLVLFVPWLVP